MRGGKSKNSNRESAVWQLTIKVVMVLVTAIIAPMASPASRYFFDQIGAPNTDSTKFAFVIFIAITLFIILNGAVNLYFDSNKTENFHFRFDKINDKIDVLDSFLKENRGIIYVGPADKVFEQISVKLDDASSVKNTLVGLYSADIYQGKAEKLYRDFFENNKSAIWKDLVSSVELFGDRFRMNLNGEEVRSRHKIKVLRHSIPLINALIIFEGNTAKSVFFGWTAAYATMDSPIFYSDDRKLVEIFDKYFDLLWNEKTIDRDEISVDYSSPFDRRFKGLDVVDKVGRWITLGYNLSEQKNIEIESYGIIDIFISNNGRIEVSGDIFDTNGETKSPVDAVNVYQSTNRLAFDYKLDSSSKIRLGFCVYRFGRRNLNKAGGVKIEYLNGFFVNNSTGTRKDVIGIKLDDSFGMKNSQDAFVEGLEKHADNLKSIARTISLLK